MLYQLSYLAARPDGSEAPVPTSRYGQAMSELIHTCYRILEIDRSVDFYERLGFECLGIYPNGEDHCTFLRLNNLTLEVWTMNPTPMENGAINHFALDSTDIEASFAEAQKLGLNFVEGSIQHIDTFWSNGIRYFNVLGPNHEVIEFCQIM